MWGKVSCLTKHRFKKNQTRTKEVTRLGYMAWTRHRKLSTCMVEGTGSRLGACALIKPLFPFY